MRGDFLQELCAEIAELARANAADAAELALGLRVEPGHLAQRHVGENDVAGHGAGVGEFLAQPAQLFEEQFVAGDFADVADGLLGRGDGLGESNFCAGLQRGHAGIGQLDDGELVRGLAQVPEPDQFAPDGRPLRSACARGRCCRW